MVGTRALSGPVRPGPSDPASGFPVRGGEAERLAADTNDIIG